MQFLPHFNSKKRENALLGNKRPKAGKRLKSDKKTYIFIGVIAFLVVCIVATSLWGEKIGLNTIAGGFFAPALKAMNSVVSFLSSPFTRDESAELKALNEQLAQAEAEVLRLSEVERENERLRGLLDSKQAFPELEMVHASIIAKDTGISFTTFIINIGAKDGIDVDMAVVCDKGLVGRVMEVGANWARVMTIVDGMSAVSGLIERTRDNGVLKGNLLLGDEEDMLRMFYLPVESEILPGDKVITSGLEGIFPRNLLIGEVVEVGRLSGGQQRYAVVRPGVDFTRLEDVNVITNGGTTLEPLATETSAQ